MGYPRLPDEKRQQIRNYRENNPDASCRVMAEVFGVSEVTIWNVLNPERYATHHHWTRPKQEQVRAKMSLPAVTDPTLLRKLTAGRA